MVSTGLNKAFGTVLRRIISHSTSNRVKAFAAGSVVAMLLQSSTATCMIVSSFAARKIITISAAVAVMLGADVGTTLAAQLMSLDLTWLMPVLLAGGYIINKLMDGTQYQHVGRALIGIGLVLLSLKTITLAAEPLKHSEVLQVLVEPLTDQPILAVLLSALLTWVVHSSLGMVLLYMGFVTSGTIPVHLGLFLVLGANIGGAFAPVIMTLRDLPAARRVPLGNLLIKCIGVILVMPFMSTLVMPFIESLHAAPARMVVNFHNALNLGLGILFLPFSVQLTRVSEALLPDALRSEDDSLPRYLDDSSLDNPPAALACASRETLRVCDIVQSMLEDTLDVFRSNNSKLAKSIRGKESTVDDLYKAIKLYLSKIDEKNFNEDQQGKYMQVMTFSTNLEHIGDIIDKSLLELADKKIRNQDNFSDQGFLEIASLHLDILRDLRRVNSYLSLISYPILKQAKKEHKTEVDNKKNAKNNLVKTLPEKF